MKQLKIIKHTFRNATYSKAIFLHHATSIILSDLESGGAFNTSVSSKPAHPLPRGVSGICNCFFFEKKKNVVNSPHVGARSDYLYKSPPQIFERTANARPKFYLIDLRMEAIIAQK